MLNSTGLLNQLARSIPARALVTDTILPTGHWGMRSTKTPAESAPKRACLQGPHYKLEAQLQMLRVRQASASFFPGVWLDNA